MVFKYHKKEKDIYGKDLKDVLTRFLEYLCEIKNNSRNLKYLDIIMMLNKDKLSIYEIKEKYFKKIN